MVNVGSSGRWRPQLNATDFLIAVGLLGSAPARPLLAQRPDLIFAASSPTPPEVDLDPITSFSDGTFHEVPNGDEDSASVWFRREAYSKGAKYWLYSGGHRVGLVRATGPAQYGCTGTPGAATSHVPLVPNWHGLAASDSTLGLPTRRRLPSGLETSQLRRLADSALAAFRPDYHPDTLELRDSWAIDFPDHHTWLVGAYEAVSQSDSLEVREFSALVVLELGNRRPARPLVWSHLGAETSRKIRVGVDILDLDHDQVPELITRTTYYESWDYQIWRRSPHDWVQWATTGGAGC